MAGLLEDSEGERDDERDANALYRRSSNKTFYLFGKTTETDGRKLCWLRWLLVQDSQGLG